MPVSTYKFSLGTILLIQLVAYARIIIRAGLKMSYRVTVVVREHIRTP